MKIENESKRPMLILTGPTAAGKTALSIALAKRIGGEIISADSMQIYKKMNIGSAKIRPEEMEGIPHYLVDELDPKEEFNVVLFQQRAKKALEQIYGNGHIPIIVGGTGFYIQALLNDIDFSEHEDKEEYRKSLRRLEEEKGAEYLHAMLAEVDPAYAAGVHANNVKRVIRALEYHHETGGRLSDHNQQMRERTSPYRFCYFVLHYPRQILYERIDRRVDLMMEQGLLEEVEGLVADGCGPGMTSMQGLGYKEFFPYFDGLRSLEETVDLIKRDTRRFAKRQLTWFRREKDVIWLDKSDYSSEEELLGQVLSIIQEQGIWHPET